MGCIRFLFSPFAFVAGAVAMILTVFVGTAIAISALGLPACFKDDSWIVSETFGAILIGITFVGAVIGGLAARKISGGFASLLMIGFAVFIALVPHVDSPMDATKSQRYVGRPELRPSEAGLIDVMKWAENPAWMRYGAAIVGVAGVLFGNSLAKGGRKSRASGNDE